MNQRYLEKLRGASAYPVFRKVVAVVTVVGYLIAGSFAFGAVLPAVLGGGDRIGPSTMMMLSVAALIVIMARVGKEISLMVADIADAVLDFASRSPAD